MDKDDKIFMTRLDLARMGVAYSNTHLLYLEKIGAFPKRIRLSPQKVVWNHAEVMSWANGLFASREAV